MEMMNATIGIIFKIFVLQSNSVIYVRSCAGKTFDLVYEEKFQAWGNQNKNLKVRQEGAAAIATATEVSFTDNYESDHNNQFPLTT
mmetsp:Transcript_17198/g.37624  ORF Transcript_17198/g.37624 Transcript_17198/m.37624 type:complete len:86 (+) Transcript_17198:396-653(+)